MQQNREKDQDQVYLNIFFCIQITIQITIGMCLRVVITERKQLIKKAQKTTNDPVTVVSHVSHKNSNSSKKHFVQGGLTSQLLPASHRLVNSLLHSEAVEESGWNK